MREVYTVYVTVGALAVCRSSLMEKSINVAITGTLGQPRAKIAELINTTENAQFVEWLSLQTHYLVCAKADSGKAKKAARWGTAVISEGEMNEYISAGRFPSTTLPDAPQRHNNFPEIEWRDKAQHERCLMTYCDAVGQTTIRTVLVVSSGHTIGRPDVKWIGGFDGPQFKTWRQDRIAELEVLPPA
jgi:hypothetical protein